MDLTIKVDASKARDAFRRAYPALMFFWLQVETKVMERRVRDLYERFL